MAKLPEKLAQSLEILRKLQTAEGAGAIRARDLSRTHRERLLRNGFLREVIKGWYIQSLAIHATRVPESSAERSQQSNNQSSAAPALAAQTPQPAPEMQSLTKALAGRWSINLKHEPNERNPNGAASDGEEVWRSGPVQTGVRGSGIGPMLRRRYREP